MTWELGALSVKVKSVRYLENKIVDYNKVAVYFFLIKVIVY